MRNPKYYIAIDETNGELLLTA